MRLGAGRTAELRIEAFNLFDTVHWANPSLSVGSTSVTTGNITSTSGDPRIMQFAIKYAF